MKGNKPIWTLLLFMALAMIISGCVKSEPTPYWHEQYDLGVRYLSEGNYEEAILMFSAVIEIDPKQIPAYTGRAEAYIKSGATGENYRKALADYETVLSLDEKNVPVWVNMANLYEQLGEPEKALEILQEALVKTNYDSFIEDYLAEKERNKGDNSRTDTDSESEIIENADDSLAAHIIVLFGQMRESILAGDQINSYKLLYKVHELLFDQEKLQSEILAIIQRADNTEVVRLDDSDSFRKKEYDAMGNEIRRLINDRVYIYYDYDSHGNIIREIDVPIGKKPTGATYYHYDADNNLIAEIVYSRIKQALYSVILYNEQGAEIVRTYIDGTKGDIVVNYDSSQETVTFIEYADDDETKKRKITWFYMTVDDESPDGWFTVDDYEKRCTVYYNPNGTVIREHGW